MPRDIRLIAVDIDGTLLDSRAEIPAANLEALRRAKEAGAHIVLATGRRHSFALPIAEQLGLDLCLISSNGAVTRSLSGERFYTDHLPRESAARMLAHMSGFTRCAVLTFDKHERGALVAESFDELTGSISRWVEKNRDYIQLCDPLHLSLNEDPIQAMFCGAIERMKPVEERLTDGALAGVVSVTKTQYDHRDLCILDVLAEGCSKGKALARWAADLGVTPEQTVAIGDNYNDLEMLEFAGAAFVMGNASEEMKQNGWPVTLDADSCGVAAALEQVLF